MAFSMALTLGIEYGKTGQARASATVPVKSSRCTTNARANRSGHVKMLVLKGLIFDVVDIYTSCGM